MHNPTPSTELAAETAWRNHDYQGAATAILEGYGTEIYSFLLAQFQGRDSAADDVFSEFREDLWRGLPSFQWRCSIRAWCYKLARSAATRFRLAPHNRADRHVPLSQTPAVDRLAARQRTPTRPHLRSEVKDEFQRLRERLSPEDQDLLILRVDRQLSWREVAHAMFPEEDSGDEERLRKYEASLRQRFGDLKRRLKKLAEEQGLI